MGFNNHFVGIRILGLQRGRKNGEEAGCNLRSNGRPEELEVGVL